MTEQEYIRHKKIILGEKLELKDLIGKLTLRQFYNKCLHDFYSLESTLEETPSLFEKIVPQMERKVRIIELTKNLINLYISQGKIKGRTSLMTEQEVLEGFN